MFPTNDRKSVTHLVDEVHRRFEQKDWVGLLALIHPEAELHTVSGGRGPLSREETLEAFKKGGDRVYPYLHRVTDLGGDVALVEGRVRRALDPRGFADSGYAWLMTFADGLLVRSELFASAQEALAVAVPSAVADGPGRD